jgi:hypothetical protein
MEGCSAINRNGKCYRWNGYYREYRSSVLDMWRHPKGYVEKVTDGDIKWTLTFAWLVCKARPVSVDS